MIFKALVLQALYNLSDDQAEYQLRDRFSFMRFLGLKRRVGRRTMPILHLDEWLGRCPNGAAFGPCATRGFGYPGMAVGRSARAARSKFALT